MYLEICKYVFLQVLIEMLHHRTCQSRFILVLGQDPLMHLSLSDIQNSFISRKDFFLSLFMSSPGTAWSFLSASGLQVQLEFV